MGRIIEIPFSMNLIEFIVDMLIEEIASLAEVAPLVEVAPLATKKNDFSSTIIVFPHRRPGVYLRSMMAERLKYPFFPPQIFSMDDFIASLAAKILPDFTLINDLDSAYLLFEVVSLIPAWGSRFKVQGSEIQNTPRQKCQKQDSSFNQFLPWGLKLTKVIGELDIEMVKDEKLMEIDMGALWGPNVSKNAGILMNHLAQIRQAYHILLKKHNFTTRERNYQMVAENIEGILPSQNAVWLTGIFAMSRAEKVIIQYLLKDQKNMFIRQNDGRRWRSFEEMDTWAEKNIFIRQNDGRRWRLFEEMNTYAEKIDQRPEVFLYSAFNTHSEVVGLRDVLCREDIDYEKTAIVLPEPEPLIPLLSEVITYLSVNYNITMGYPIIRTPVYAILDLFMKLQESKRNNAYYFQDYLSLLMHPYIKNINYKIESTHTRILIHLIEKMLIERGKIFINIDEIEEQSALFERASQMTERIVDITEFKEVLCYLHNIFIRRMEGVKTLAEIGRLFEEILVFLLKNSPAVHYPFSGEFFHTFFALLNKIMKSLSKEQEFKESRELFALFRYIANLEHIPFQGEPLKGMQILGLLETRCLNFDNVFILSANEGSLPSIQTYDSLLPLSLRAILGMPTHYQNEEIYAYHFHHLVSCARYLHIFYQETEEKDSRSRFVEKLVWEEEKRQGKLKVLNAELINLKVSLRSSTRFEVTKSSQMLHILQNEKFSASKLNSYLTCPAQFYFANVLGLKEEEGISDEIDTSLIGTILHRAMEQLYRPFVGKGVLDNQAYDLLEDELNRILEDSFIEKLDELRGEQYLLKELALHHLKRYIKSERDRFIDKIRIISVEQNLLWPFKLKDGMMVKLSGKVDRIDCLNSGEYFIIDYKIGGDLEKYLFKVVEVLSSREDMKEKINSLQLPLYILLYQRISSIPYNRINSRLIHLQTSKEETLFNEETDRERFTEDIFIPTIRNLIGEILDERIPFMTDDTGKGCQYCPFPAFCRR